MILSFLGSEFVEKHMGVYAFSTLMTTPFCSTMSNRMFNVDRLNRLYLANYCMNGQRSWHQSTRVHKWHVFYRKATSRFTGLSLGVEPEEDQATANKTRDLAEP